jgi:hypothetical protein
MSYVSLSFFDGSLLCFECLDCILFLITQDNCSCAVFGHPLYEHSNVYSTNCVFVGI